MTTSYQEVSIIMLAVNQLAALTKPCLESIWRTSQETPAELVLVDNGSTDGTGEYFHELAEQLGPDWVKVHSFPQNVGIVSGRIKGMELATRDFILLLDNDTLATRSGWLSDLQKPLLADPQLGAVGQTGYHVIVLNERWTLFVKCPRAQGECDVVQGYCMMFRAQPYRDGLAALDPGYGMLWHDESDLCMQLKRIGYRITHMDAGIDHKVNATIRAGLATEQELVKEYVGKTAYFSKKWFHSGFAIQEHKRGATGPS